MKAKLASVIKDLGEASGKIAEQYGNGVVNGFSDEPCSQTFWNFKTSFEIRSELRSEEALKTIYDEAKKLLGTQQADWTSSSSDVTNLTKGCGVCGIRASDEAGR